LAEQPSTGQEVHMATFIIWTIWAAHAAAIIAIDHSLLVRRARARGEVDFSEGPHSGTWFSV
jgi:hypothetical protein